jgi:hypothetical protein
MSKERKEELFRALNTILDAVTALNLRDLEAKAAAAVVADQGETSAQGASASSKGNADTSSLQATECTNLVSLSTKTQILSLPRLVLRSLTIKSKVTVCQGFSGTGNGCSSP